MFDKTSEKTMRIVRWLLTIGWLVLILSLFYDPISAYLTKPEVTWSLFHLNPEFLDPQLCHEVLEVQGKCVEAPPEYPLGTTIFWGMVVPSSLIILLVFGHELWRRICPLSFLSQIPRALGWQRQRKVINSHTGAVRYELAKVSKDSWLGRNHLYLQFGLFYIGLTLRILLLNSNRIVLGSFLLFTITAAIFVGYWFGGKSWCQYFCPMAPVQMVFTGTRSLLGSEAHQGENKKITQSMCRTVTETREEKSVCVGCQSPCIDIDAERSYWEILNKPGRKLIQYGYVGIVIGFYGYYTLYSGTLNYYYSGAWTYEKKDWATLFNPGFYINNHIIPIPRLIAVPVTMLVGIALSYFILSKAEKAYKGYLYRKKKNVNQSLVTHRVFSFCTFISFNIFFMFGGRPVIRLLPFPTELAFNSFIILVSTLWLYKTLSRSQEAYYRESLANSLRRQLSKLNIDFSRFLEGTSLEDMKADAVYVLAKILPNFNREYSWQVYKGMLKESLEQGNIDSANSLEILNKVRLELDIKEEEHFNILTELGIENPDLLDPSKRRTVEQQLRLQNYREALEMQLVELVETGVSVREALKSKQKQNRFLKQQYGITLEEEEQILAEMFQEDSALFRTAESLITQLKDLTLHYQILNQLIEQPGGIIFVFLQHIAIEQKQHIIVKKLLNILEVLGCSPEGKNMARLLGLLAENILTKILQISDKEISWQERLAPEIIAILQPDELTTSQSINSSETETEDAPTNIQIFNNTTSQEIAPEQREITLELLQEFLQEIDPLIQSASLYALRKIDPQLASQQAYELLKQNQAKHWLVEETAENLLEIYSNRPKNLPFLIVHSLVKWPIQEQSFQKKILHIGRSETNDIVLSDPRIAPQHAILYRDEQGVSVEDLGSPNGVYIHKQVIHNTRQYIQQGDVIRFGNFDTPCLTVYWDTSQSETTEDIGIIDKLLLLFGTDFFRELQPEALVKLARDATLKNCAEGTILCQQGDPSPEIFLLVEGAANVIVKQGEEEKVVNVIYSGETVGEMGVLTGKRRSATVVTTGQQNRILSINAKSFESVVYQDSGLAKNLVLILSSRLQRLTSRIQSR